MFLACLSFSKGSAFSDRLSHTFKSRAFHTNFHVWSLVGLYCCHSSISSGCLLGVPYTLYDVSQDWFLCFYQVSCGICCTNYRKTLSPFLLFFCYQNEISYQIFPSQFILKNYKRLCLKKRWYCNIPLGYTPHSKFNFECGVYL